MCVCVIRDCGYDNEKVLILPVCFLKTIMNFVFLCLIIIGLTYTMLLYKYDYFNHKYRRMLIRNHIMYDWVIIGHCQASCEPHYTLYVDEYIQSVRVHVYHDFIIF